MVPAATFICIKTSIKQYKNMGAHDNIQAKYNSYRTPQIKYFYTV